MCRRFLSFSGSVALICLLEGCATPTPDAQSRASASATTNPVAKPAGPVIAEMPFPKLEQGTTADVIREKLGAPAEIQPMPSPEGKAEVWIYHYTQSLGMTQVAAGTRDRQVMATSMSGVGMTTVQEPVFTLAEKISHITLSLLLFNGRLQVQKAAVQETIEHH